MGVQLLDQLRMKHIWRVQKCHVRCIQDVPGVQLYTEAGTIKGGVTLTRYQCARGSTSMESFYCHLNRFIPGWSFSYALMYEIVNNLYVTLRRPFSPVEIFRCFPGASANALNFQLYLLEGLNRWNQDRGTAAVTTKSSSLLTCSGDLANCVNTNSLKVFGWAFVPTFRPPAKYTGMSN